MTTELLLCTSFICRINQDTSDQSEHKNHLDSVFMVCKKKHTTATLNQESYSKQA